MVEKRVEAVSSVWAAVIKLHKAKATAEIVAGTNEKAVIESPEAQDAFRQMKLVDYDEVLTPDIERHRPFLSEVAWSLFAAYQSILATSVAQYEGMINGIDMKKFQKTNKIKGIILAALPDQVGLLEELDIRGYFYLIDLLEQRLLAELRRVLSGEEASRDAIELARNIEAALTRTE